MLFPARATADSTAGACSRQLQRHVRIARHACVPPHFLAGCVGARRILQRRDVRVRQRGPRSPGRREAAPPAAEVSSESFESLAFAPSVRHVDAVVFLLRVVCVAVRVAAARRGAPPVHARGPAVSAHSRPLPLRPLPPHPLPPPRQPPPLQPPPSPLPFSSLPFSPHDRSCDAKSAPAIVEQQRSMVAAIVATLAG